MMVKAMPTSTFVMAQAEFTFELFVITFDTPAQFGIIDECGEGCVLGQSGKPVFRGSRLSLRPFGEQPFDRMRCGSLVVPRGEVHAQLWLILGDGVNQAADLASGATSIPSWNLTPWMTFGNWF